MSQTEKTSATVTSPWEAMYAPIEPAMRRVEARLREELRSPHSYVDQMVRYGCLLGGKRLRPALLLLSGQVFGALKDDHILLATVVEMIHTATLVHDDMLDNASVRRHRATINARWDNEASVLLGDFLFTHAFYLASTLGSTWACREIGRATNTVCEGEIRQKGTRGRFDVDEREYLGILDAKTAALCACCCRIGARCSGVSSQQVDQIGKFGRDLGIAFQIADDLLDLEGDEAQVGKSLGTDLAKQKPTLPIIRALAVADDAQKLALTDLLENPCGTSVASLNLLLDQFGAIEYARQKAVDLAAAARNHLRDLPESPARKTLAALTEFVVNRNH